MAVDDILKKIRADAEEAARQIVAEGKAAADEVTAEACAEVVEAYWNLGDLLWTKYDEKW